MLIYCVVYLKVRGASTMGLVMVTGRQQASDKAAIAAAPERGGGRVCEG